MNKTDIILIYVRALRKAGHKDIKVPKMKKSKVIVQVQRRVPA